MTLQVRPTEESARLHSFDSLRAAMMLLGIILHGVVTYTTFPISVWPFKEQVTSRLCDFTLIFIHVFRMPLFFVLAGFFACLLYSRLGVREFVRRRAKRVLLPFAVGVPALYFPVIIGHVYGANSQLANPWSAVEAFFTSGAYLARIGTMHLWFLYYLLCFYAAIVLIGAIIPSLLTQRQQARIQMRFRSLARSSWRPLIFAVPTCGTLYFMQGGFLETNSSFILNWRTLAAYGVFFAFGWFLFKERDLAPAFQKYASAQVAMALILAPINFVFTLKTLGALPRYDAFSHTVAIVTGSLIAWLLIFGLMGLTQRYLNGGDERVRYVADASYWIYLVHLPVVLWLQIALVPWNAPALIKVAIVCVGTFAITLATYRVFVRYTVLGKVLNGARSKQEPSRSMQAAAG
jgi:glucans biosynthesis protein C